jgi:Xaa-Pro aminopeptidase
MMAVDTPRLNRLQKEMKKARLDALVCRLPENVVYLTDYWPHHGVSVALMPQEGPALLFLPDVEQDFASPEWAHITPFGWGHLQDEDVYVSYGKLLGDACRRLGLSGKKVGVERGFETVAPTYRSAEPLVPALPWEKLLAGVFANSELVDSSDFLQDVRAVKTDYELGKLVIANEVAEMGLHYALDQLAPGLTEAEVGARIEYKIRACGVGYKGARAARSNAEVCAGKVRTERDSLLIPSSSYLLKEKDLVMVEIGTVVDGYWSDLTYMAVVGEPDARQIEVHNTLLAAQQAAAQQMRQGNRWGDPDRAARQMLEKAGLGQYFIHGSGHGVGLRYHESIPSLGPGREEKLVKGMVSSIEPGVYIPDFGGIRIEDNVAVGEEDPIFLSTPRKPW